MRTTYELKLDRAAPSRRPAQAQGGAGRVLAVAAVAAATAAALWWWWPTEPAASPGAVATPTASASASAQWWNAPSAAGGTGPTVGRASPDGQQRPAERSFELDASGQLRLDARALVKLEQLVVLTAPHELPEVLESQLQGMPPAAAAALRDLVQRYEGYTQAQKSADLAEAAAESPEAALAELDQLRSLREHHFGAAAAESLFGDDERIARQLLAFMREDTTPGASMDEKAMRAQARYDAQRQAGSPAVAR